MTLLLVTTLGVALAGVVCVWTIASAWLHDRAKRNSVRLVQKRPAQESRATEHVVGFILGESTPRGLPRERVVSVRVGEEGYEMLVGVADSSEEPKLVSFCVER